MDVNSLSALLGDRKVKVALLVGALLAFLIGALATLARAEDATDCTAYSQPLCADVPVILPYSLDWSDDEGKLADKTNDTNGDGTGFTMVQPSSNGGRYLPENLDVDTTSPGTLKITTTRGIQFRTSTTTTNGNTLDNGLGVGFDAANKAWRIETTIVNPPNGSNAAEQAGLWFGPNEDNYVKLVIASSGTTNSTYKVQLMKEINGGGPGGPTTAPEQIDSSAAGVSLANRTVKLVLIANPSATKVDAYYSISGVNNGAQQFLGSYSVPASFFDGTTLNPKPAGVNSFAGVFATHRNRATTATPPSLVYTFDDFRIVDAVPPAAPAGLAATAGNGQIELDWDDNTTDSDLKGYNVYRSLNKPVSTSGTPLNGSTPLTNSAFADTTAQLGTNYYYDVKAVDNTDNASAASGPARAMLDDATPKSLALPLRINFQDISDASTPSGYIKDYGQNYANTRGFGWVEQSNPGVPLNLVGNGRNRNDATVTDLRLRTLMHMQGNNVTNFANIAEAGAWEVALPDGNYDVEVSVGDPSPGQDATSHEINVEGVKAIDDFGVTSTTTGAARFKSATVEDVAVNDGKLTIDAIGGTNTKINYVDISEAPPADNTAPGAPSVDLAAASDSGSSDTDNVTKETKPTFTGKAEAGSSVELYDGEGESKVLLGETVASGGDADANGDKTYELILSEANALAEGTHQITATATDAANNTSNPSAALSVSIDTTAPGTTIGDGSTSGIIGTNSASFSFTSSENDAVFECKLARPGDPGSYASCTSPKEYTDLGNGAHTFSVKATDVAGNAGAAAERAFEVDTAAPDAPVITNPEDNSYDTDGDVTVAGTATADLEIQILDKGNPVGTTTADGSGAWSRDFTTVAEGEHTYTAKATNSLGVTSGASNSRTVTVDTTDPGAPANLTAQGQRGAISLDWDDSPVAEEVVGYNVYRSDSEAGTYTKLNDSLLTASAFNDAPLPDETTRYYQVTAVDRAGNESERASKSATTLQAPDETPPGAPTGLTAAAGDGQVALDWADNPAADGVASYDVFRATSASGPFNKLNASPLAESQYTDSTAQNGTTYYYNVKANDGVGNVSAASSTVSAKPQAQAKCPKRSLLECAQIKKTTPVSLEFSGSESGLADKDGEGTGFTMVDPPSARLIADNPVYHTDVPGYEPGKLNVANGRLAITSTKGIMFRTPATSANTNSQINALGVGVDAAGKVTRMETTVAGPSFPTTGSSEQGGIWFGLNEDNYAKLVVFNQGGGNAKIQMLRERGAVANDTTDPATDDQLDSHTGTAGISGLSTQNVKLTLVADAAAGNITGYYQIGSGAETKLGTLTVPATFFEGTQIASDSGTSTEKATFAGLFDTHRNGTNPITLDFENFSVISETPPADTIAPSAPTGLAATAGDGQVALDWEDNTENDLAGYNVYRGTTASVDTSVAPLNGATPVGKTSSQYTDATAQNGTTYHYVVTAVDASDNESGASSSVSATPQAAPQGNPLALEFDRAVAGTVNDKDGEGTGFASVQPNGAGNAYDASRLDLQAANGELVVTATQGTNTAANTLKNALRLAHDGTEPYEVSTRLVGPLTNLNAATQQGGIYIGPDQDNYVKLVASHTGTTNQIQFFREINGTTDAATRAEIGYLEFSAANWSAINTLDLFLTTDPATGSVMAEYAINGGARQALPTASGTRPSASTYTVPSASRAAFFNADSKAGILAFTVNAADTNVAFERFEVKDVQSQPDTTAPTAPQNLRATAGDTRVDLAWDANSEGDVDGYNVYRGTSDAVDTSGQPLNASLLEQPSYADSAVQNGTTYHYVVQAVDTSGNKSGASARVSATPRVSTGEQFNAKINFQSAAAPVPTGYFRDYGQAYGARTGADQGSGLSYGWVTPTTKQPLDLSVGGTQNLGNGRDRNDPTVTDQRLDTLMHMQGDDPVGFNGTPIEGAWEIAVPNGTYEVTLSVGDASQGSDPMSHEINVEGVKAIDNFVPNYASTPQIRFKPATVTAQVSDGKLTIDANGGTNTKINYVDIASIQTGPDTMPPSAPANVVARAGDGEVSVVWNANTETDLDGYNVYAGSSATGTPLNGATLLKTTYHIDRNLTNGTERTYVVEAVDRSGNKAAAQPVSATPQAGATDNRPRIISTNPADGATDVALSTGVAATLNLVTDGVDESTFSSDTVKLIKVSSGTQVPASYGTSGGNDVINLIPNEELEPNTQYRFEVTDGVKDLTGTRFLPYTSTFTTGTTSVFTPPGVTTGDVGNAAFDRVAQPNVPSKTYTSVTMGPDNRLYAGTITGEIYRFDVGADGNLSNPQIIDTIRQNNFDCNTSTVSNNGCTNNRLIIGLTFEPGSTAESPKLWVTHSFYGFNNMKDWGGKLSVLSGANLGTYRDVLVNLPRSSKDHLTNSIAFKNGKIYIPVGATTAMGAFDNAWKGTERLLSAAVIEVDYQNIQGTLDVKTADGGTYDPYASGAPVKIFATGVRNAVDLVWHSNGNLYTPTNGSAGGSNVPATPDNFADLPQCKNRSDGPYTGPAIPDFDGSTGGTGSMLINKTQDDYLFRVVRGGYYGNPNPSRCEWVLNGGNPTAGSGNDPGENPAYPAGTKPDRNWRGWAYDFKNNQSPNGVIEYKSSNFGGKLKGKLLVVRYSQGDDIIVLEPGANGNIAKQNVGVPGLNKVAGSEDPLDLIEDTRNGNLYVTEGVKNPPDGTGKITLLRARDTGEPNPADVSLDKSRLVFNEVQNGSPSAAQTVTVTNSGGSDLTLSGASLSGANADQFQISAAPTGSVTLTPGQTQQISVLFNPTSIGPKGASLDVSTNDADTPVAKVNLRGLGTLGTGGANEPSLQWILDTYEIPINVGDPDPTDNAMPTSALLGDEIAAQSLERAYAGSDVSVEPLAVFGPQDTASGTVTRVGNYASGQAASKQQIFSVPNAGYQSLNPTTDARYDFAPAGESFGFYSIWPFFGNREVFSEDSLNTWETNAANRHKVRVYPLKNKDGSVEQNAYVVATEEHNSGFDYQDVVYIVRNAKPVGEPAPENQEIDAPNPKELVFSGVKGSTNIPTQSVSVKNSGRATLEISGASISGTNAGAFQLVNPGAKSVPAGETATFEVRFAPSSTTVGSLSAKLTIASNDADEANVDVGLYGLSTNGEQGSNEPTLQDVVNTLGYPVKVHDLAGNPLTFGTDGNLKGEEVSASLFQKAGSGSVTIKPVARYSPDEILPFGYYKIPDGNVTENVVATIDLDQEQTLNPKVQPGGSSSFDPGADKFGIFVDSKSFNRKSYQQDGLNTGQVAHAVRVYPAKDRAGQPIANSYLVTFEDAANGDYQDYVFFVTNVRPSFAGDTGTGTSSKVNFQPATAVTPSGYEADTGQGYSDARGYGWVALGTTGESNAVNKTADTRERNASSDQLLDTLILMQNDTATSVTNGAWEYAVPNGSYEVKVSVGDPSFTDSVHEINVEGVKAIDGFVPTTSAMFASTTVTVPVSDGKLTIDAVGGTNTKLNYVEILSVSGNTPESISQQATPGSVVTTDTEQGGNGATPADPMETTIMVPSSVTSGTISISEKAITETAPSGFAFFGQQADITGPAATAASPYTVVFELDPSTLPSGANENTIQMFKDGQLVQSCASDAGESAKPDPCVITRARAANNDVLITVRTSGFSSWNAGVSGSALDTTAPEVNVTLSGQKDTSGAYRGIATVNIEVKDSGGSGLDKTFYSLDGEPYKAYTAQFSEARDAYVYALPVTKEGNHTIQARAIDRAGNTRTSPQQAFSVLASKAEIELENGDGGPVSATTNTIASTAPGVPFPDRLAMSRIQNPEDGTGTVPKNYVHDVSTLRVKNTGTDPLSIISAQVTSGPFQLENAPAFPATVPAGGSLDLKVRFVATSGAVHNGTLTLTSDDADEPTIPVELSGFWQSVSEGNQEPNNAEIAQVFGYGTTILYPGQQLNSQGRLTTVGDEVISPYWQRANTSKPVTVRQLAAYHTQGNTATFYWHAKGSNTTTGVLTHLGVDGQSLLPRRNGTNPDTGTTPAYAEFAPSAATFGFKIDPEWSDWTKNNSQVDIDNGCTGTCGHHVRFWPVRDRAGKIVPNQYLVGMDYSGINYDFNDNVYLVTNIKPENAAANPAAPAPLPGSPSLNLAFDKDYPGTLEDKDGTAAGYQANTGTGFTSTQRNENDQTDGFDSYRPELLDIDTTAGTLAVRTFGTDTTGSNGGQDNTLVNGLRTNFDASAGKFAVGTKLNGPLNLTSGNQQGGVMFGPDQDNFVKLVAINNNGAPAVEFFAEQNATGATQGSKVAIPAGAQSVELFLLGDPNAGTVQAAYRIDGGNLVTMPNTVTLTGTQIGRFFAEQAKGGIITQHKGGSEVTVTFDNFTVTEEIPGATPEPQRDALYRLDVAGSGEYTDSKGNLWKPDTGLFAPSTAPNEGATTLPQEIANTDDDVIYRTYRGNVGNVAQDQRVLTYNLPTRGAEQLDLRLHFAERASANNTPGKRVFDIEAEGRLLRDDFDIYAAAGGQNSAIALPINNVAVNDGNLTLALRASADYPSIAGIEVLCEGACPAPDTQAPAAPAGLTATGSANGIALDWANNAETDLAGYNVYRASSATGTFTKVNDSLLTASQYNDAQAPAGAASYYQVKAVDSSGNESSASNTANATRPATGIRINAGGPAQTVSGTTWSACSSVTACNGYVTGGFAYSEADTITGIPQGMNNTIFQSEWTGGATGSNPVPVGAVAFKFDVPVANGSYNVRLHFAELNKTAVGTRVFDVNVEGGTKELVNFDIFKEAGGIDKAIVREIPATVSDGKATIEFYRQVENAKISAIEILPVAPDTQAPAAPTGLTAAVSSNGINLDWADNTEQDLAGYNVYRATSATGNFAKINNSLLTSSQYNDTAAPSGASYYQVKAVDKSGNESGASNTANATRPEAGGFTNIAWTTAAAQQFGNSEAQGEVVNGKLYVFGGFDSQKACCTPTSRAYVYDPVANNWTPIKAMPAQNGTNFGGVTHAGFATDGEDIYWAGGYTANAAGTGQIFGTKEVWKYDVESDSYSRLPDLPQTPESGASNQHSAGQMEYINGELHLIGGTSADRTTDVGYHFVLDLSNVGAGWKTAAPVPNPRQHSGSAVLGGKIYYIGGQHEHDAELVTQSSVHAYDPATNQWAEMASMPVGVGHIANSTFPMGGRIIVAGGETAHGVPTGDVRAYDPQTNAWKSLTSLPASRVSGVANTINGLIFFTTGGGSNVTYKGTPEGYQPDAAAPTVTDKVPAANATNVAAGENVTATFSEAINEKTVTGTTFTLVKQGTTTPVAAKVSYDVRARKATLDSDANLDSNATYTATIKGGTNGVKDLSGNALTADETWSFTTKSPEPQASTRINTGGAAVTTGGVSWGADQYFSGGKSYTNPSVTSIAGTTDDALYLNERSATTDLGSFSYAIPVSESGTYTAKLHFAEIYWGATGGGAGGTGKRVFSANLEGGAVELANYDINADVGPMTAVVKSYDVSVTDGTLNIAFSASVNQPTVAAIEVLKAGSSPTDTTAPTVSDVKPLPQATDVAAGTNVTATFSEEMDASTIDASTFKLTEQGATTPVSAAVTYDAATKTATLNPNADLAAGKTYTATITTGAKDKAGNALAADKIWAFTSAPPADTTPPTVTGKTPAANATDVAVGTNVTATFSEEMSASTINASTFKLVKSGTTTPVTASVTYDAATKTATLDPSANLDPDVVYTATVTTGAKDVAGNAMADTTWSFTTAPPADTTVPTVIDVAPGEGASRAPASVNVRVTFSEAMNATTINGTTFTLVRQGTTTPVAATVTYDAANNRAILNPSADLVELATYTATLRGGTSGVKDLAGNPLAADKSWSFTTDFSAPSNLSATRSGAAGKQRIVLSWIDNSSVETKYVIERSTTSDFTSNLVTREVGANVETYRDTAVARNTRYYYRVLAVSSTGVRSDASNVVSVTTKK